MKLLYVMALLIFGASVAYSFYCNTNYTKENRYVLYNSTELEIAENFSGIFCNWGGVECYTECTFFNLTTNITDANNNKTLVANNSITDVMKKIFSMDGKQINCDVIKCVQEEISKLIEDSSKSDVLKEIKKSVRIKKACSELFASSTTIKKAYTRAEKTYIDALVSLPFNERTKIYDLEEFSLAVVKMNMSPTDLGLVQLSAPKVPNDDLPLDIFIPTEPFVNVSDEQQKVGVVNYPSADQFITDKNIVLKSKVIRVEAANCELKDLPTRLVINFSVNNNEMITNKTTLACRFYNVDASQGQEWDDKGSFTNLDNLNSSRIVSCSYDHMTPFAVLLVDLTKIDHVQWKILSYISYIGCSLSLIFSVITILLYTFLKSSDRNNSIRIHVSLSTAYLLLNTSFLFIEWGASWSQESLCVVVAVIIQYSLLSSFSWMAIEAIHLYLLLIKVFNTYIKHYMIKLSLFGWGVPAILVGGSLCGYQVNPLYGTTKIKLFNTSETTEFCWITDIHFLYGMNITYFSITFLFNLCILTLVTHRIFKMQNMSVKSQKLPRFKDICTVLGLTFLMGMTWGLAFFTSGYTNYPILYLFCICNTMQGLFLFLWFYGTMKKNKHLDAHSSTVCMQSSTTVKTTESSPTL